jgi:hypothetical protein
MIPRCRGRWAVALLAAAHCGAPRPRNVLCREAPGARETVHLFVGRSMEVPAPCPRHGRAFIDGTVTLAATEEGLRVQLSAADASYVPGPYRDPSCDRRQQGTQPARCQRDAVVLFPDGTASSGTFIELDTIPIPSGYRVDQVIPWATWGIERGVGRFRLALTLFDRGPAGDENELRFVTIVRVSDAHRDGRDHDAGRSRPRSS